jgi:3-dehydroquinate dehydratase-2
MILLVNGPNLNLLGEREPDVYGRETLADVERMVAEACAAYGLEVKAFQSNWEGALLDFLQEHRHEAEGVIVNPGALTHTSRALHDCLKALPCPAVEVHISNIHAREAWRRESVVAPAAVGQITGLGVAGYYYAAIHLCSLAAERAAAASEAQGDANGGVAERGRGAQPALGAEHAPYANGGAARVDALSAEPPDEIPVDVNARGEYEPL